MQDALTFSLSLFYLLTLGTMLHWSCIGIMLKSGYEPLYTIQIVHELTRAGDKSYTQCFSVQTPIHLPRGRYQQRIPKAHYRVPHSRVRTSLIISFNTKEGLAASVAYDALSPVRAE